MSQPAILKVIGQIPGGIFTLYAPAAGTYADLQQLHIVNAGAVPRTVTLYIGAFNGLAAGTEIFNQTIAAKTIVDEDICARMNATDFLTGQGGPVTVTVMGEVFEVV